MKGKKKKELSTTLKIDPPSKDRPQEKVVQEILHIYRAGYNISIAKACQILCCERQWIEDYIIPNVKHIFVTHFFGQYIADHYRSEMSAQEIADFSSRMYFLSRTSLSDFYKATAAATRKTELRDISLYRAPEKDYGELMQEKERHAGIRPNKSERTLHLSRMKELLTPAGYSLYTDALSREKEWKPAPLPAIPFEEDQIPFRTTAQIMAKQNIRTNTSAYYYLEQHGAIRVRFGGKILWYIPKSFGNWLVPCSYNGDSADKQS